MAEPTGTNHVRIPKLCRHKATGQAVVRLNGKDVYCGRHGSPEAQAKYERLIIEWLQRGRQLPTIARASAGGGAADAGGPAGAGLTVAELILAYKRHTDELFKSTPVQREKIKLAMRPLRELYALTPVASFGPLALKAVREKMVGVQTRVVAVRNGKKEKVGERVVQYRLSRGTINARIDIIKRMIAWGTENELVPASVFHALQAVKGLRRGRSSAKEARRVQPVQDAQVEAVLPLVSRQVRALIELQRLTGARPGEVILVRICDIDRSGPVWVYRPARHKNQHREGAAPREVLIGPRGQAVLQPFLERHADAYLFSPREAREERYARLRQARKSKVQPSQQSRRKSRPRRAPGGHYTVFSYRRAIVNACKRAGVEPWHPHQLRHSAATRLRKLHGVEMARIVLGHATAFTTEIYAEADRQQAAAVMSQIG
jgi:integrase